MTNMHDSNDSSTVIDLINHSIVADTNSPSIPTDQFLATWRARRVGQITDGISHAWIHKGRARQQALFAPAEKSEWRSSSTILLDFDNGFLKGNGLVAGSFGRIISAQSFQFFELFEQFAISFNV